VPSLARLQRYQRPPRGGRDRCRRACERTPLRGRRRCAAGGRLVNQMLMKVDGDPMKPPVPTKEHDIPSELADAVSEGGSVDEYATHVYANSTKTACIDPRGWIDLLPRAFNDILPHVNASIPGLWSPRHDETDKFLTKEKRISSHDEYRHLACYGDYSTAAIAALETALGVIRSTTATAAERPHGRLDTHGCHASRRVATYLCSPLQGQEGPYWRGASRRTPRALPLLRHTGGRPQHQRG
jgi:hypothetical protein